MYCVKMFNNYNKFVISINRCLSPRLVRFSVKTDLKVVDMFNRATSSQISFADLEVNSHTYAKHEVIRKQVHQALSQDQAVELGLPHQQATYRQTVLRLDPQDSRRRGRSKTTWKRCVVGTVRLWRMSKGFGADLMAAVCRCLMLSRVPSEIKAG